MAEQSQKELEPISDAQLIEEVKQRRARAFSVLYDRYSPRLYGLALKILKDEAQAQDVLQDIFLTVWKNAEQFDSRRGQLLSWMMALCRNRCIDRLRAIGKKRDRFSALENQTLELRDDHPSGNPLEMADYHETQRSITNALERLPQEQRQLIEMAYFGGLAQSEISKKLDLPLGTVKTRIRLGMQKLRAILDQ